MRQRLVCWAVLLLLVLVHSSFPNKTARAEEPQPCRAVEDVWSEEYQELTGQINRLKNWRGVPRERLQAETLDQQALTLPEDKDPLDIVLRRTAAMVGLFEQRQLLSPGVLIAFENRLQRLTSKQCSHTVKQRACQAHRVRLHLYAPTLHFSHLLLFFRRCARRRQQGDTLPHLAESSEQVVGTRTNARGNVRRNI